VRLFITDVPSITKLVRFGIDEPSRCRSVPIFQLRTFPLKDCAWLASVLSRLSAALR
jgi:hypothetical protein